MLKRSFLRHAAAWPLIAAAPRLLAAGNDASPPVIRIGVATGGVGNPVRFGGSSAALVHSTGALEEEFKADGTKIEWVFFKGAGPAVNEALVNKQLDLAWQGDLPSIVHRAGGVKTRIIAGSGVRNGLYLAVPPDSAVKRIEDLRGKRIALYKGTNLHLAAVRALAAHGLKESDVRLINLDLPGAQAALATKDIDGAFGYVELFVLRDKGVAKVIYSASEDSFRYTRQTVLLASDDFARNQPRATQRIVNTLVKVARRYSDESQRDEVFAQWGKAEVAEKYWREDFIGQPLRTRLSPLLDPFLVQRYKDSAEQALALKLVRGKAEIDSWFDRSFLDASLRELKLENYWPVYEANGEISGKQVAVLR
ncbi:nitrate ABC transporter substrate-binding protein [Variovorax sp. RKNM96]|uniref:ABC transporter substrate-binding protein n=1 Tax=Variovorax sp. RKNM96 TaxID=2681552 RepID=UPI00198031F7|nr:ABC transporter substrate-binding protein [Variovorax sp. RKNM96]QSI31376.1 nitrate ABC transporter substrate-binding protein [Variovorax sp. RKNM96]